MPTRLAANLRQCKVRSFKISFKRVSHHNEHRSVEAVLVVGVVKLSSVTLQTIRRMESQ